MDHALDEAALDGRIGPALDANGGGAAATAEQDVDHRVDQRRVGGDQAVVLPRVGLEDAQHRRQRHAVEIVAEAHRADRLERDLDVVGGELAQARRHQPDQTVEDDLQHRQAFVGQRAAIEDRANAGDRRYLVAFVGEAEQAVDLVLIEDRGRHPCCFGSARRRRRSRSSTVAPPVRADSRRPRAGRAAAGCRCCPMASSSPTPGVARY